MNTFTPGPWTIGTSCDHTPAICVPCDQSSGFVVAHINRIPLMRNVQGNADANARLIAAAPDLLKGSASAVARLHDLPRFLRISGWNVLAETVEECLESHRAAITKAIGAQS